MFKKHEIHDKELSSELHKELDEIHKRVALLRKKGIYTNIVEYMISNIPSKIKMASITHNKNDVNDIRRVFNSALAEINFLELQYQEEQKRLAYLEGLFNKLDNFLDKKQLAECIPIYNEIRNFYKALSLEAKQRVIDRCAKFYFEVQAMAK
jgi:hypothetical protein